jgi:hypothetical protein
MTILSDPPPPPPLPPPPHADAVKGRAAARTAAAISLREGVDMFGFLSP